MTFPFTADQLEWYRSITFVLNSAQGHIVPEKESMVNWLLRFNDWFIRTMGVERFLQHIVPGRTVHIHCDCSPAEGRQHLTALAETATRIGFVVTIMVRGEHLESFLESLPEDREQRPIKRVTLEIADGFLATPRQEWLGAVDRLLAEGMQVHLKGNVREMRDSGLIGLDRLNQSNFIIYPSKRNGNEIPLFSLDPCSGLLAFYVNAKGEIYPCGGLNGIAGVRLGHIDQPIEETILGGAFSYPMDMTELACRGPRIKRTFTNIHSIHDIPMQCRLHRLDLLADFPQEGALVVEQPQDEAQSGQGVATSSPRS
ncbi:MAG: hypothetical protein HQL76_17840 [Magnetococcales bacterium]|nr:hypothetical protein [Magnetococcales bacterium]